MNKYVSKTGVLLKFTVDSSTCSDEVASNLKSDRKNCYIELKVFLSSSNFVLNVRKETLKIWVEILMYSLLKKLN